jgi:SAM-dependent methyltransferase
MGRGNQVIADLLKLLTCPLCRDSDLAGLDERMPDGMLTCSRCGASYPVRGGIPILLPPDFDGSQVDDELDDLREHKRSQADYFDREVAEEFEISRPHGAPPVYQWLMAEKFRRSVELMPPLRGPVVVDVCCGSGMDSEFLAREGARVIAVDISEGCAARARARAERYGLDYLVVVGDVEHLPIRTDAADMSYVHDGLHHLTEPVVGVRELARVARRAVSINEPADAIGTQLAVRMGIAANRESAGNRVARLRAEDVSRELQSAGFEPRARRYLMYYKHEPGGFLRFASRPVLRHVYRLMVGLANVAVGRWGNKLQVTAVRAN